MSSLSPRGLFNIRSLMNRSWSRSLAPPTSRVIQTKASQGAPGDEPAKTNLDLHKLARFEKTSYFESRNASSTMESEINTNPISEIAAPAHSNFSSTGAAYNMMHRNKNLTPERSSSADDVENIRQSMRLAGQIARRWKAGDVYAPHDLHQAEQVKFRQRVDASTDIFDALDMNPLEHYRNFSLMSEWMTPMGRIKSRKETGLRPVNQRRIAKAIRRSIGIGMMPSVHRHPEIMYKERVKRESEKKYR
ncbi:BgTH12-02863 [Blumeria graminis f. sp. triticale]|nr:BgTH12-02863 [Blumeria graminis f. sp. triticale]